MGSDLSRGAYKSIQRFGKRSLERHHPISPMADCSLCPLQGQWRNKPRDQKNEHPTTDMSAEDGISRSESDMQRSTRFLAQIAQIPDTGDKRKAEMDTTRSTPHRTQA